MKKKFLTFMLAICLILPCMCALVACGKTNDDATAKVMNVSLNPKIEFILDKDDKVLSVNALNEDGNHIISMSINETDETSEFEGMNADEAIELFLDIAEENGYLSTGDEEEIKIEISGNADNLMKKVKDKANQFLNGKNFDINVVTGKIEKSDILNEVKESMKEYTQEELENMTQEQLVDLLKKSRQETKNLYSQELKDAYYNMRIEKINIAELEALLDIIENLDITENSLFTAFKDNMTALTTRIDALEQAYNDNYLSEESDYYKAKQAYIEAKKALLEKRLELRVDGISEDDKLVLATYETEVENARIALENAKVEADLAIEEAKGQVEQIISTLKSTIEQIKTTLNELGINLDNLNNAKQNAKDDFKNHFEQQDGFGGFIGNDKTPWGKQPAA